MLSKKLAIAAASAALMLGAVAPAFAYTNINNNEADVTVHNVTVSNSGVNGVVALGGGEVENSSLQTGDATAVATVGTEVNFNTVNTGEGCVTVNNSDSEVDVTGLTVANSGVNGVVALGDGEVESSTLTTGNATSVSDTQTLVNVNKVNVVATQ